MDLDNIYFSVKVAGAIIGLLVMCYTAFKSEDKTDRFISILGILPVSAFGYVIFPIILGIFLLAFLFFCVSYLINLIIGFFLQVFS